MIGWIIFAIIAIIVFIASFYIVRPTQRAIVERLGKFHRISDSGFHFLIPIVDQLYRIPIVEQTIDVDKQPVITKDNVSIMVDGVVYLKVLDVKKSIYAIDNYKNALTTLAQTNLRSIIGTMQLDEVLNNRDIINGKMVDTLDKVTKGWGVDITRMEIQELAPPKNIREAMEAQVVAERKKRETIITSEGVRVEALNLKEAKITEAQASKESEILVATGQAQAIKLKGIAEAVAIKKINTEMKQHGEKYVQLKQIEQWRGDVPQFVSGDNAPFLFNLEPEKKNSSQRTLK